MNAEAKMELDELHKALATAKDKYHANQAPLDLVWRRQAAVDKFWERQRRATEKHIWVKD